MGKERDKGIISTKMETNSPEYGGRTKKKSENISLGRVKFFRVSFSMAKLVLAPQSMQMDKFTRDNFRTEHGMVLEIMRTDKEK